MKIERLLLIGVGIIGAVFLLRLNPPAPPPKTQEHTTEADKKEKTAKEAQQFEEFMKNSTTWEKCIYLEKSRVYRSREHRNNAADSGFSLESYANLWAIKQCAYAADFEDEKAKRGKEAQP